LCIAKDFAGPNVAPMQNQVVEDALIIAVRGTYLGHFVMVFLIFTRYDDTLNFDFEEHDAELTIYAMLVDVYRPCSRSNELDTRNHSVV
jgi:hypothetical protein